MEDISAVKKVLFPLIRIHYLEDKKIKSFTVNQNAMSIVDKGSTKTVLQKLTLDILLHV
jgi:hypothetical protein